MKTWNVKKLSNLAKVTKRTLHYYDKIGLLKPSHRLPNGYRAYSEQDYNKLKKIVSLKFCGFKLAEIRLLLDCRTEDALKLFSEQLKYLQAQMTHMEEAQLVLMKKVLKDLETLKALQWESMIEFINSYKKRFEDASDSFGGAQGPLKKSKKTSLTI